MSLHVAESDTAPVAFHRLARVRPRARWWAPVLTGVLGAALYLALLLAVVAAAAVIALFDQDVDRAVSDAVAAGPSFDLDRPWLLVALLLPLALMTPILLLASRIVQGRGAGFLASVAGRLRWGWLWRTLALAFGIHALSIAATLGVPALMGEELVFDASHAGIPVMLVVVILLVPLQAAAEEYVFRGYLMQLVGTWLRHPAFAILLPAPLFVLGHGYDIWGGLSVGAFAVVAAWLSWRTGGLEAAIAMHIANNVLIFVLASFGLADGNATEGTPIDLIVTVLTMLVFALIADRWARARGIARTAPMPAPMPAPTE